MQNELGFDEVVDSFADAIQMETAVRNQLADGVQLLDVGVIVQEYPRGAEILADRKVFAAQFKDLTPEEAVQVPVQVLATLEQRGVKVDKYSSWIYGTLEGAAMTYEYAINTRDGGQKVFNYWKEFLTGPEEEITA